MNPKISIIVPVYKVEKYIHKCVDSILSQTFTDFELILVNDGSPDFCGEICNQYTEIDNRVKVIHKKNGGLSDARNTGIEIAKGDYIGFVDSDDWIEPDMYQILYDLCIKNDCEIATCTYAIVHNDKRITNESNHMVVQNRNEAMQSLLEGKLYNEVVWTKLFKRSLFENQRFTVGIIHEDTDFTYRMIHESKKICSVGMAKYNYLKRDGSIMERATKNVKIDSVTVYDKMYKFMNRNYPELCTIVSAKLANSALYLLNLMTLNKNFRTYKNEYIKVTTILNHYFIKTIKLRNIPLAVKILLIAIRVHPLMYKPLISMYQRGER